MKEHITYFFKNFIDVFKSHYIDFQGSATRRQFWCFILGIFICCLVLHFISDLITLLFILATMIPCIAITVRRVRNADFDPRLGFISVFLYIYILLNMIPIKLLMAILSIVNIIILIALIIFCALPPQEK